MQALERHVMQRLPQLPPEVGDERLDQQRNVAGTLPQRGKPERNDVQAIEQVSPKATGPDGRVEVPVCGGDQAHVHADRVASADALQFLLLHDPQQLNLAVEWQLADLVEQQSPAVRLLEPSNAALQRAGECAPFVLEQLALDESGGHRAAVQLD